MNDKRDLELIIRSHIPIVAIETNEELRALELLKSLAHALEKPVRKWSATQGLVSLAGGPSRPHLTIADWQPPAENEENIPAPIRVRSCKPSSVTSSLPCLYCWISIPI